MPADMCQARHGQRQQPQRHDDRRPNEGVVPRQGKVEVVHPAEELGGDIQFRRPVQIQGKKLHQARQRLMPERRIEEHESRQRHRDSHRQRPRGGTVAIDGRPDRKGQRSEPAGQLATERQPQQNAPQGSRRAAPLGLQRSAQASSQQLVSGPSKEAKWAWAKTRGSSSSATPRPRPPRATTRGPFGKTGRRRQSPTARSVRIEPPPAATTTRQPTGVPRRSRSRKTRGVPRPGWCSAESCSIAARLSGPGGVGPGTEDGRCGSQRAAQWAIPSARTMAFPSSQTIGSPGDVASSAAAQAMAELLAPSNNRPRATGERTVGFGGLHKTIVPGEKEAKPQAAIRLTPAPPSPVRCRPIPTARH